MGLRIATNIQSIAAQRSLSKNRQNQASSLEKLSSGNRINRAGDDAAGLAISERLKANIRSLRQATRNAEDGISLVQVAEGAMNEISNIMIRMRELSIQTASDTVGNTERGFVNKEMQHLKAEIERIATITEFNGAKLLSGDVPVLEIQVGIGNNPAEDRLRFNGPEYAMNLDTLGLSDLDSSSKESSQENLMAIDGAITRLNSQRSGLGALQNRMQSTINNQRIYTENLQAANSRIRDTDMAEEVSHLTKNNVLTNANVSVLGQANQNTQVALRLLQ